MSSDIARRWSGSSGEALSRQEGAEVLAEAEEFLAGRGIAVITEASAKIVARVERGEDVSSAEFEKVRFDAHAGPYDELWPRREFA